MQHFPCAIDSSWNEEPKTRLCYEAVLQTPNNKCSREKNWITIFRALLTPFILLHSRRCAIHFLNVDEEASSITACVYVRPTHSLVSFSTPVCSRKKRGQKRPTERLPSLIYKEKRKGTRNCGRRGGSSKNWAIRDVTNADVGVFLACREKAMNGDEIGRWKTSKVI